MAFRPLSARRQTAASWNPRNIKRAEGNKPIFTAAKRFAVNDRKCDDRFEVGPAKPWLSASFSDMKHGASPYNSDSLQ
jgi:hypothetical protein